MDRIAYYNCKEVLFEIVKFLKGRETAMIAYDKDRLFRCIKAHTIYFLMENFKAFHFLDDKSNLYYSLAHYFGMPMMTFNMKERIKQQADFKKNYDQYYVGYDMGFDFDAKEFPFEDAYADTKRVRDMLVAYKVPFFLKFSGSGFHINIEFADIINIEPKKIPQCNNEIAKVFKYKYGLKTLDQSIYDFRRIWKVPYSWDVKTDRIALPLTDEQFDNFDLSMVDPVNVVKSVYNRGSLKRNFDKNGFVEMILDNLELPE